MIKLRRTIPFNVLKKKYITYCVVLSDCVSPVSSSAFTTKRVVVLLI